jgi:hypothetical protein
MGVEDCYEASTIPDAVIIALQKGTSEQLQQLLREEGMMGRGGMLHRFKQLSLRRLPLENEVPDGESVFEQLERQLGTARRSPSSPGIDRVPSRYQGAILSPKNTRRPVLAWATWTQSLIKDPRKRTQETDQSVADVVRSIEAISLDAGLDRDSYLKQAHRTLLFDTLNGREKGAASLLWSQLVPRWREIGYSRILLYRHKILQIVNHPFDKAGPGISLPRGNNDESEEFFKLRGLRDIGTHLADYLAVRPILQKRGATKTNVKEYYVLSTEGWMYGDLEHVEDASIRADQEARKKFGL